MPPGETPTQRIAEQLANWTDDEVALGRDVDPEPWNLVLARLLLQVDRLEQERAPAAPEPAGEPTPRSYTAPEPLPVAGTKARILELSTTSDGRSHVGSGGCCYQAGDMLTVGFLPGELWWNATHQLYLATNPIGGSGGTWVRKVELVEPAISKTETTEPRSHDAIMSDARQSTILRLSARVGELEATIRARESASPYGHRCQCSACQPFWPVQLADRCRDLTSDVADMVLQRDAANARVAELEGLLASVHAAIGDRGTHGANGNAACAVDWIASAKEGFSERREELHAANARVAELESALAWERGWDLHRKEAMVEVVEAARKHKGHHCAGCFAANWLDGIDDALAKLDALTAKEAT